MLGDGVCDPTCSAASCQWDLLDCGCAPNCAEWEYGECKPQCLTPDCNYDAMPLSPACADPLQSLTEKIFHLSAKSFAAEFDFEKMCQSAECPRALWEASKTACVQECNTLQCLGSFGNCGNLCDGNCAVCAGRICMECAPGFFQFFSECVRACPTTFSTHPLMTQLCYPDADTTAANSPVEFFVTNATELVPQGTAEFPFRSVSEALCAVHTKFARIWVLAGTHQLALRRSSAFYHFFTARSMYVSHNFTGEVLEIRGCMCGACPHADCANEGDFPLFIYDNSMPTMLEFSYATVIADLRFLGNSTLLLGCESELCQYCPFVSPQYKNDRGYTVSIGSYAPQSVCDSFINISLIVLHEEAKLTLLRVSFEGFRQQMKSLINLTAGELVIDHSQFINCMTANATILQATAHNLDPGSIVIINSKVSLLNNGYELKEGKKYAGFLFSASLTSLTIESSEFRMSIVGVDGSLLVLRNFVSVAIADCTFDHNIGRLVDIDSNVELPTDTDSSGQLLYFSLTHISVSRVNVTCCTGSGLIAIRVRGNVLNVNMADVWLLQSLSTAGGMVKIASDRSLTPQERTGGYAGLAVGEVRTKVYFPRATVRLSGLQWSECAVAGEGLLVLRLLPNVYISALSIRQTKPHTLMTATLADIIADPLPYISTPVALTLAACGSIAYFESVYNLTIAGVTSVSNVCGSGIVGVGLYSLVDVSDAELRGCTNSAGDRAIVLDMKLSSPASFSHFTVSGNANTAATGTSGAMRIEASTAAVTVRDSTFEGNSLPSGPALSCSGHCILAGNRFISNVAKSGSAVAVLYAPLVGVAVLSVSECLFLRNFATTGAALAIYDTSLTPIEVTLSISSSSFDSNESSYSSSCLLLSAGLLLSPSSLITYTDFSANKHLTGCIYTAFTNGALAISQSAFRNNTGVMVGILYAVHGADTPPSVVRLRDTVIEFNNGGALFALSNPSHSYCAGESTNVTWRYNNGRNVYLNYGQWTDANSTFLENETIDTGYAFLAFVTAKLTVTGSRFLGNVGRGNGGAIYVAALSVVSVTSCLFQGNFGRPGTLFFVEQNAVLSIADCKFLANHSMNGALLNFFVGYLTARQKVVNSTFAHNVCDSGTAVATLMMSNVTFESCAFANNSGTTRPDVNGYLSEVYFVNTTFQRKGQANGPFITITADSKLSVAKCLFEGAEIAGKGAALYISSGSLQVADSVFRSLKAATGAAVAIYSDCKFEITGSTFEDLQSTVESGGSVVIYESKGSIATCIFLHTYNGGVSAVSSELTLTHSTFSRKSYLDGQSDKGAGVYCIDCPKLEISDTEFRELAGTLAAAVYLQTSSLWFVYSLARSSFLSTHSTTHGAVVIENADALIADSLFANNTVADSDYLRGSGAAIYLTCPDRLAGCEVTVSSCVFRNNSAKFAGGAIAWTDSKPAFIDTVFQGNHAPYGPDVASFAVALSFYSDRVTTNTELFDVGSGQQLKETVYLYLLDHYNQVVSYDNSSYASVQPLDPSATAVSGVTRVQASSGVFAFAQLIVTHYPGETTSLEITTNGVDTEKTSNEENYTDTAKVKAHMRLCSVGEALVSNTCEQCPYGKFNLEPGVECDDCPTGATCYGNSTLVPKSGYWRSDSSVSTVWKCPEPDACIGSPKAPSVLSLTGDCAKGFYGNLCHGCLSGYSRSGRNDCSRCPEFYVNCIRVVGVAIAAALLIAFIIKMSLISAHRTRSPYSVYLKIFVNYLQLLTATVVFEFNWPSYVLQVLNIQESAGNISERVMSIDCIHDNGGDDNQRSTVFLRAALVSSLPLVIVWLALCFWVAAAAVHRRWQYLKTHLCNSIVILFFLVHPSIIKIMFDMFNCKELDYGKYWLSSYLNIQCWDAAHRKYAFLVALPSILLWGIATPLAALVALARKRRQLDVLETRIRFGFLYTGYRTPRFYWEFIILYRKVLIISIAVFILNISIPIQALAAMLVLVMSVIFQMREVPFQTSVLNQLELRGILVAAVTVYCGMWFLTDHLGEAAKLLMLVIIVLVNAYFLFFWAWKACGVCLVVIRKLLIRVKILNPTVLVSPDRSIASMSRKSSVVPYSSGQEHSIHASRVSTMQYDDSSEDVSDALRRAPRDPHLIAPDNSMVPVEESSLGATAQV